MITALNFNTEDEYGKSASVQLSRTKAERDEGKKSVYVGNGWHNPTKATADDTPF